MSVTHDWNSYNSPSTDKVFTWGPSLTKRLSRKNDLFFPKSVTVDLNFYSFRDRVLEKHKAPMTEFQLSLFQNKLIKNRLIPLLFMLAYIFPNDYTKTLDNLNIRSTKRNF